MLPSIDIRIQNLIKAIQQVVLPAVDPGNKLAQEQAQLVVAHLRVIGEQWDHAHEFETLALRAMQGLAHALVEVAEGGERTLAAASQAATAARSADGSRLRTANAVAALTSSLGSAIDELIFAISDDGSDSCRRASKDLILDYSLVQARRERIWFAGTGLDPDRAGLPSIESMLG